MTFWDVGREALPFFGCSCVKAGYLEWLPPPFRTMRKRLRGFQGHHPSSGSFSLKLPTFRLL
jgi:hypothetical protein